MLAPISGNCIFKLFGAITYNSTLGYDSSIFGHVAAGLGHELY